MTLPEPMHDIAHLGSVELLTPRPEQSLWYFRDLLGMEVVHTAGASVHLRGYGDHAASTLKLTEAEAKKFWPIYDTLQRDLVRLNRERNLALETLAARDRPLSDAYAKQVVNDLLSIEEQEIKALRKASNATLRALPPKKAARYMQLENKLRAVQDYEIAVAFPLAQ